MSSDNHSSFECMFVYAPTPKFIGQVFTCTCATKLIALPYNKTDRFRLLPTADKNYLTRFPKILNGLRWQKL